MPQKVFDIILKSKYSPEGVKGAVAGLKSISEAGFFIRQGLIGPLAEAGRVVLDFIAAANPERVQKLQSAFDNLKTSVGRLLDQALGPTIDELGRLVNNASLLSNIGANLDPIYTDIIKRGKEAGLSAEELAKQLKGASDAAVEATRRAKAEQPFLTEGVNAEDAAIKVDKLRAALLAQASTFPQYIAALRAAGVEIKNLREEYERFAEVHNIVSTSLGDVLKAQQDFLGATKKIESDLTKTRADLGQQRSELLQNIAIAEGRRLQDQARTNAQALRDIDATRVSALQEAEAALSTTLAQIATESSRNRVRIEQDFQDQIKQINESSGDSIEDAIERRDARALARALRDRDRQLNNAASGRDKALAAEQEAAQERRRQAQEQYEQQRALAEQAAQTAQDQLRKQNAQAAQEAEIAGKRQLQDFDIAAARRVQKAQMATQDELKVALKTFSDQQTAYRRHLDEMTRITDEVMRPQMPLAQAIARFVEETIGDVIGELTARSQPLSGGR